MGIFIGWRNSAGGSISSSPTIYNTLTNTWELVTTGPVIAPANAATARAEIRGYKDLGSPAGYADNAKFSAENVFIKYCMPDLGQHTSNWCWVASAANSIYWYSQHGYLQLIDDPAVLPENDNAYITQMVGPAPDGHMVYRLFAEIMNDCGHPFPANEGVYDNEYYYGLRKFMMDQNAPLVVHEIVDPSVMQKPPADGENVIYRSPTLMDYEMELENCQDVLLWLDYENYYGSEDTAHVVTGVGFSFDNSWILVSDPWTTGGPDHNNLFENKKYDNLKVLSTPGAPLDVQYGGGPVQVVKLIFVSPMKIVPPIYSVDAAITSPFQAGLPGMTLSCTASVTNTGNVQDTYTLTAVDNAGWNPTGFPPSITVAAGMTWLGSVDVTIPLNTPSGTIDNITFTAAGTGVSDTDSCIAQVTTYFIKYCMPDLGQHSANWCWVAAAANSIYWYSQHGYLQLIDAPENAVVNDNNYITQMVPVPDGHNVYRLFFEIASDCGHVWNEGILDNEYYFGLQKFMSDQGAPLRVHEIVNPALVLSPPPASENVIYRSPTLTDYESQLENCQDVLLWLHYRHTEGYSEDTDHVVTGVGFSYDNQWLIVSDPWTPGAPDHSNDLTHTLTPYDDLQVISVDPLWVLYNGIPVQVSKVVFVSPEENILENVGAPTHLVAGWNLVGFTGVSGSDTPDNVFKGLTYITNYLMYYWNAPGGPYGLQDHTKVLKENVGYWVWIDRDNTVSTTGVLPVSENIHLVAGWNLVHFSVGDNDTPDNVFKGLTYITNYLMYYWNAPGGPYGLQDHTKVLKENVGYWVWIDRDNTLNLP